MENTTKPTSNFALTYGVLLGILSILQSVALYVTNNHLKQSWITSLLGFIIIVVVISMGLIAFKKSNNGYMSLSQALKVGLGIAVISGIIVALYTFVFATFIEPDLGAQAMEIQREKMIESGKLTTEQIDQSLEMGAKFAKPWIMATFSIIGSLFFGFIVSLIAGLILKKDNPYQD